MSLPAHFEQKPVDRDPARLTASIPVTGAWTDLATVKVRTGYEAKLVAYRQAWDPAGDGSIYHRVLVNGVPHNRISDPDGSTIQEAAPENPSAFLPVAIPLPQGAVVLAQMRNTDAGNAYNGTAVIEVQYFALPEAP